MNRRVVCKTAIAAAISSQIPKMAMAAAGNWDEKKLEQAANLMGKWVSDGRVHGATIFVTQGHKVFSRSFGLATSESSVFRLASITKPMTAAAVMTLVDKDEIKLEDRVVKYFPQFGGEERDTVTIRNLLTHSAGLPDMLGNDEMLRMHHAPLSAFLEGTFKAPLKFKPGSQYSYSSMGFLLASEIARKVTGVTFAKFIEKEVFRPLGMSKTSLGLGARAKSEILPLQAAPALTDAARKSWESWNWNSEYWFKLGAPWGDAMGSASDIARFYAEFLNLSGNILKPATEHLMITNQSSDGVKASGLGFDLPPNAGSPACSPRTFGHNGSAGTLSWADPVTGTICIVFTTLYEAAVRRHPNNLASDLIAEAVSRT